MSHPRDILAPGPFRPHHVPPNSEYELDRGHPIHVMPTLPRGGSAQLDGSLVIGTDPNVGSAGVEVGFDLGHNTLRAPDVAVLPAGPPDQWARSAPPLAIEYADRGQDEADLRQKIGQLLGAGTLAVWVVRLQGPQRVEVYEGAAPMRTVTAEGELSLPGVLSQPFPAAALFDREVAHRVALRNLLARFGYRHPEEAYAEGRDAGLDEGRRDGLDEGRRDGLDEGRRDGLAQGRRDGLAEGRRAALQEAVRLVLVARGDAEAAQASAGWSEEQLLAALSRG